MAGQAAANLRDYDELSLSVFASIDLDVEGIVREARKHGRYLPHGTVHTTTAKRLRQAGFSLRYSPPPPGHYALMIPDPPTDEVYVALMGAFDGPIETPQGRMPRDVPPAG